MAAKWEYLHLMFLADLDNDDKPKRLMEAKVNIMQVFEALNRWMISSYHLVQGRARQEAELGNVFLCR